LGRRRGTGLLKLPSPVKRSGRFCHLFFLKLTSVDSFFAAEPPRRSLFRVRAGSRRYHISFLFFFLLRPFFLIRFWTSLQTHPPIPSTFFNGNPLETHSDGPYNGDLLGFFHTSLVNVPLSLFSHTVLPNLPLTRKPAPVSLFPLLSSPGGGGGVFPQSLCSPPELGETFL